MYNRVYKIPCISAQNLAIAIILIYMIHYIHLHNLTKFHQILCFKECKYVENLKLRKLHFKVCHVHIERYISF